MQFGAELVNDQTIRPQLHTLRRKIRNNEILLDKHVKAPHYFVIPGRRFRESVNEDKANLVLYDSSTCEVSMGWTA